MRNLDGEDTIIVENTNTGEAFTRRITDITIWKDTIIVSWDKGVEKTAPD